jgi:coenzyme F420-reducing hydrogenase delta subunit
VKAKEDWKPRVVAYLCNWCPTAAADVAGVIKAGYPASVSFLTVPCAGSINPILIMQMLLNATDGVVVIGCSPGDCHHLNGNMHARRKFMLIKSFLDYIGIAPERFQFAWVTGSEGSKLATLMRKVVGDIQNIGPQQN